MQVNLLFKENNTLDEENKRLLMLYNKERNLNGSSGKHTRTASAKVRKRRTAFSMSFVCICMPFMVVGLMLCFISWQSNKRKSSSKMSSPIEKKIDFSEIDSARKPLSPLRCNSPESRTLTK